MSDAAGYEELAERMGKVRRVYTGPDGGVTVPLDDTAWQGVTIVNGDGDRAEEYLRSAAWQRPAQPHPWAGDMEYTYPPELMTSGACIATMQAQIGLLLAKVAALETENIGLRTNIANLEKRCTCMEGEL